MDWSESDKCASSNDTSVNEEENGSDRANGTVDAAEERTEAEIRAEDEVVGKEKSECRDEALDSEAESEEKEREDAGASGLWDEEGRLRSSASFSDRS